MTPLDAISPADGRYHGETAPLADWFSERALIRCRIEIEIAWLKTIAPLFDFAAGADEAALDEIAVAGGRPGAAEEVKKTEQATRHDVKAAEYWIAEMLGQRGLERLRPLVHFGCTSWDINNLAMSRMLAGALQKVMGPALHEVARAVRKRAEEFAEIPMLARTHGQPASPTTLGKEFANFYARMLPAIEAIGQWRAAGKMNGATGNYNAHIAARPDADWPELARRFVERQDMDFASHTTQIEPYDRTARLFDMLRGANSILLDFCRDMWGYISLDYFCQQAAESEVGSSTMPHKINPIDFENAEGNIGIANALLSHLSDKLPVSRWQRDLSDSTALRSIGMAFAHSLLAWNAAARGLARLSVNAPKLDADLEANWQVLAEAVQTVLRAENAAPDAYEQLKTFSRGQAVSRERLHAFIRDLPVASEAKDRLLALTPQTYCGDAAKLARALPEPVQTGP